jgi:hypothetical protein
MPVNVRVIPITEFLRTDVAGHLDLKTSRVLLRDLMEACKAHNADRVLIDTREATSDASVLDVWTLASDLQSAGLGYEHRVAVLNRPKDNFDRGAFLETCATNRGYQLKAFRDFEAAFTWLTDGASSIDTVNII